MSERSAAPISELERALVRLGRDIEMPEAGPDLAFAVVRRIEAERAASRAPRVRALRLRVLRPIGLPLARRLALATVAAVVLAVTVVAASPSVRRAVADFLGLRGVHIIQTHGPPPPSVSPKPLGEGFFLGRSVTLVQARAGARFPILLPRDATLGEPDDIRLSTDFFEDGQVSFIYGARPGMPAGPTTDVAVLITEFRAKVDDGFIRKFVGAGVDIEGVRVRGHPGFWIAGDVHEIQYVDPDGVPIPDSVRLVGNVLLWQVGDVTLRLEGDISKAVALRIASRVR
jgi:hypothetical protein